MVENGAMEARDAPKMEFEKGYPVFKFITKELILHCQALGKLFWAISPIIMPILPTDTHKICYVVRDVLHSGGFLYYN